MFYTTASKHLQKLRKIIYTKYKIITLPLNILSKALAEITDPLPIFNVATVVV